MRTEGGSANVGRQKIVIPEGFLEWEARADGTVEIRDVHVESEHRRTGLGRKMLETLFKRLRPETRVWAITGAGNLNAQQFYEGCLFRDVSPLRRFYGSERLDALMYVRSAGGPV